MSYKVPIRIGRNLKFLRKKSFLLQSDVAKVIGVCRTRYVHIENGKQGITLNQAMKVCEFFNIKVETLVTEELFPRGFK